MDRRRAIILTICLISALALSPKEGESEAHWLVVIDAGHGGKDPGAISISGTPEKQITLEIARLVEILAWGDPQLEVVLTRRHDQTLSLRERIALANRLDAAVYVSIHANAHANPSVQGVETLVHDGLAGSAYRHSLKLAQAIQSGLIAQLSPLGVRDRGVKRQPLYLRWAKMPAVLVEVGFITHPLGERQLRSLWYQAQVARAVLMGIKAYLSLNERGP